jgi:hypothetical protein
MQPIEKEPMYFTMLMDRSPAIMCENHARAFEQVMIAHDIPHTIYELEDDDEHECHACNLQYELTKPRIILPN